MISNTSSSKDLRFVDVYNFFKANFIRIIGFTLIFFISALVYLYFIPPTYKATIYIKPGRVSNNFIYNPVQLYTFLSIPSFYSDKVINDCNFSHLPDPKTIIVNKLEKKVLHDSDILKISIYSSSNDLAIKCLDSIFNHLLQTEEDQFINLDNAAKDILKFYISNLYTTLKDYGNFDTELIPDPNIVVSFVSLLSSYTLSISNQYYSYKISKFGPIHVSNVPVSPNKKLYIFYSITFGFSFGILISLWKTFNFYKLKI